MAIINLKINGADQAIDIPWFTESTDNLLGNPRPSTLQDIEKDQYWLNLFNAYCHAKGAGPQFDAWAAAGYGNGAERDALKAAQAPTETKGTKDIREAFRADLGFVKAAVRESKRQQEGLGEELHNTFDLEWGS
jgi:hypothetical protein